MNKLPEAHVLQFAVGVFAYCYSLHIKNGGTFSGPYVGQGGCMTFLFMTLNDNEALNIQPMEAKRLYADRTTEVWEFDMFGLDQLQILAFTCRIIVTNGIPAVCRAETPWVGIRDAADGEPGDPEDITWRHDLDFVVAMDGTMAIQAA